jgi:isopentenyldiphosphate isomerase
MAHELGYRADQIEELHYITRVHYRARCAPPYNEWGEHEIDYCLLNVRNDIPPPLPNANEVADTRYVTRDELAQMFGETRAC